MNLAGGGFEIIFFCGISPAPHARTPHAATGKAYDTVRIVHLLPVHDTPVHSYLPIINIDVEKDVEKSGVRQTFRNIGTDRWVWRVAWRPHRITELQNCRIAELKNYRIKEFSEALL